MKLYQVAWEEDGKTVKAPGVSETEVKRCKAYYAASSIERVWEEVAWIRRDPERRFQSVSECDTGTITVLTDSPNDSSGDPRG